MKQNIENQGELELTEKTQFGRFIFWGSVFIVIGIFILFYSKNHQLNFLNKESWFELLFHIGMALLISGILVLSLEIISRRFHLRRSEIQTKKLSEDILASIFEQFTPKEIRNEVIDYVFKSDFFCKNYDTQVLTEEVSIGNEIILKLSNITKIEIHNPTSEAKEYVSSFFMYDVDTIRDLPKPIINNIEFMDENHNVLKTLKGTDLENVLEREDGQLRIKASFIINAFSYIIIRKSDTTFLRKTKDYLSIAVTRPTVNLRLSFKFPNEHYRFWCTHDRPGSQESDRFRVNIFEKENLIEAEANGGLLPYQGIMLQYIYMEE